MASTSRKRENSTTDEEQQQKHHSKRQNLSSLKTDSIHRVKLNPADCDLAFHIEGDGLIGYGLRDLGFAYWWSGARGDIGITTGKYCFGCKIIFNWPVSMHETHPDLRHISCIGISRGDDLIGKLGETKHSFGYDGTGKFSNAGESDEDGERFGIGDTIVCLVDLESKPFSSLGYTKNGEQLGVFYFEAGTNGLEVIDSPTTELPWKSAFFPHILLKNTAVKMQFSIEDGLVPKEGYKPWDLAIKDGNAIMGPGFSDPNDREVIMMVGLPASGKTTWAENWIREHPEKRYILLGSNMAFDHMKIPGLKRKRRYDEILDRVMDLAAGIFNTLFIRASQLSRNYIIDQTNVSKGARMLKLKPFFSFRKIAVLVFPRQEELKLRSEKRFKEIGKEVPSEEINEMLDNFSLPMSKDMYGTCECFDKVIFTDLSWDEAQQHLNEMKRGLQSSVIEKLRNFFIDSRFSASCLPGSETPYSGCSKPGSALQPNIASVNRGCTGFGQHSALASMQQHSFMVNTRAEGPRFSGIVEPAAECNQGMLNPMLPGEDRVCPRTNSSYREPLPGNNPGHYGAQGYGYDVDNAGSVYPVPVILTESDFETEPSEDSWIGLPAPALQPNAASLNREYTRVGDRDALESLQQYTLTTNNRCQDPKYSGIFEPAAGSYIESLNPMLLIDGYPREDRGYSRNRDPVSGNNPALHRTTGNGNDAEGARSVKRPPDASPYGTPSLNPQESYPTGAWHPDFGANIRPEGILEPAAGSYRGNLNPIFPFDGGSSNLVLGKDRGGSSYRNPAQPETPDNGNDVESARSVSEPSDAIPCHRNPAPGNHPAQPETPDNGNDVESARSDSEPSDDGAPNPRPQKGYPPGVLHPRKARKAWHPTTGVLQPRRR